MLASVAIVRNPFNPMLDRELFRVFQPSSINDYAPDTKGAPFIAILNGEPILRADWSRPIMDGDALAFVVLPQGDDDGGSNVLQIILTIVVMIYAPEFAGMFGEVGSTAYNVAQAGFSIAGMALINVLVPPPKLPSAQTAANAAAASPTYNLQAQGNAARLDGAIPVQYGRLNFYPDFAAQPYLEYSGNEQFLYQLLCLGQGEYDIEAVRIEDTPIANFEEIEYEIVAPGGTVTLFPSNVTTSGEVAGQKLETGVYLGPFTANAAGTQANHIGFDFVMPRGLYYYDTGTGNMGSVSITVQIEARVINDSGVAQTAWSVLGTETYAGSTTTPQRRSVRYQVTPARYECQVKRTTSENTASNYGHEIVWAGLRTYLPETSDFGGVTLLALRARASNNLSQQASRKINVTATRKLPTWNGSSWSANTATSSLAWAFADACRNTTYGAKLADAQIDLATLLYLDSVWSARGDQFNARFDSAISFWEAITKIGAAGRAKPYMQGGIVRLARDGQSDVPVAMYSMRNIKRGSFSVDYMMPSDDTADHVEVSYWDSQTWSPQRVLARLTGVVSEKPAKIETFGVTSRAQAYREGMYHAASNRYRRRIIKFSTEMEGFLPSFGDLITVQHDMPAWGQHAEIVAWDAMSEVATLSDSVTFTEGQTHYIALRTKAGATSGPYIVTQGATDREVVFASTPSPTPYVGSAYERTHVAFGFAETWSQKCKVVAIRPRGLYEVEIEAINEDPSVHTAESGLIAPPIVTSQLGTIYTSPVITNLTLRSSASDNLKALLTWAPAPGAEGYQIEMASGSDPLDANLIWTRVGETTASNYAVTALYGAATLIRVRGIGIAAGPWLVLYYGSSADFMFTSDAVLMWSATDTDLMWRF